MKSVASHFFPLFVYLPSSLLWEFSDSGILLTDLCFLPSEWFDLEVSVKSAVYGCSLAPLAIWGEGLLLTEAAEADTGVRLDNEWKSSSLYSRVVGRFRERPGLVVCGWGDDLLSWFAETPPDRRTEWDFPSSKSSGAALEANKPASITNRWKHHW